MDIVKYDVQALSCKTGHETSYNSKMTPESERFLEYNCKKTYADGTTIYKPFSYFLQSASSYTNIPGLLSTNICGTDCEDMVPQGICDMDGFVLISAYCYKKEHPAVLYVMKDKTLVATIVLPFSKNMHAGGVTYDGEFVWLANGIVDYGNSDKAKASQRSEAAENADKIYYLKKSQVISAITESTKNDSYSVSLPSSCKNQYVSVGFDPAFCSYFEGYLWCGKFSSTDVEYMDIFKINHKASSSAGILTKIGDMQVPRATQGLAFYRHAGQVYLMISSSYDRNPAVNTKTGAHSLITYKPTDYDSWVKSSSTNKDFHKGNRLNDISIPYMSENLDMKSSAVFIIFESAAKAYSKDIKLVNKCDKFCQLSFYKICVE